jgi:hypothetical protein
VTAPPPAVVTLHLWGVPRREIPRALTRMATHRRLLHGTPGLTFGKLLGTGSGRTFAMRDADPRHWAVLAVWRSPEAAESFETGPLVRAWDAAAHERLRVRLRPVSARGTWAGCAPFGEARAAGTVRPPADAPVAAITRARIRPGHVVRFWRAVPPVSADLHRGPGVRLAVGISEAPVGMQGTFSLWDSAHALTDFAYRRGAHTAVIRRTAEADWFAEELFARFVVLGVDGVYLGREP